MEEKIKKIPIMTLEYRGQYGAQLADLGDLAEFRRAFARTLPPLFHNHQSDGRVIYRYPKVQYRLRQGQPSVVLVGSAVANGAALRAEQLSIELIKGVFDFSTVKCFEAPVSLVEGGSFEYEVRNFMLNPKAHGRFVQLDHWDHRSDQVVKPALARSIVTILEEVGAGVMVEKISVEVAQLCYEDPQPFKGQWLRTLRVRFSSNLLLPWDLGLGKAVAQGFGTLTRLRDRD